LLVELLLKLKKLLLADLLLANLLLADPDGCRYAGDGSPAVDLLLETCC
jgi:hypothetical protein